MRTLARYSTRQSYMTFDWVAVMEEATALSGELKVCSVKMITFVPAYWHLYVFRQATKCKRSSAMETPTDSMNLTEGWQGGDGTLSRPDDPDGVMLDGGESKVASEDDLKSSLHLRFMCDDWSTHHP